MTNDSSRRRSVAKREVMTPEAFTVWVSSFAQTALLTFADLVLPPADIEPDPSATGAVLATDSVQQGMKSLAGHSSRNMRSNYTTTGKDHYE